MLAGLQAREHSALGAAYARRAQPENIAAQSCAYCRLPAGRQAIAQPPAVLSRRRNRQAAMKKTGSNEKKQAAKAYCAACRRNSRSRTANESPPGRNSRSPATAIGSLPKPLPIECLTSDLGRFKRPAKRIAAAKLANGRASAFAWRRRRIACRRSCGAGVWRLELPFEGLKRILKFFLPKIL